MKSIDRADRNLIKQINTQSILRVIRDNGPLSRADIAKRLGLNSATVSSNVSDLINLALVRETGIGASSGGRKPILLELDTDRNLILGICIDVLQISAGLVRLDGNVLLKEDVSIGTDRSFENVMDLVIATAKRLMARLDVNRHTLLGIGLGVHGIVDSDLGISIFSPGFNWQEKNLRFYLETAFNLPVFVDNDVRAMALGEKWFGGGMNCDNFILLSIDKGIGSAIFLNGEIYRGADFGAGEIGHIPIAQSHVPCSCGKSGCLEALASSEALKKRLQAANMEEILKKAAKGDSATIKSLDKAGHHIGRAISIAINMLNPKKVLLTGEVVRNNPCLWDAINEEIQCHALGSSTQKLKIEEVQLGDDLRILGAATVMQKEIFSVSGLAKLTGNLT